MQTNLSFTLLVILTFLTENRKPKTENGNKGLGEAAGAAYEIAPGRFP